MSTWGKLGLGDDDGVAPWGLPSELLAPAKTITDPIHGDIRLNRLECLIVDSPAFQRLRHVKQLG
jgi:hypothetical protein